MLRSSTPPTSCGARDDEPPRLAVLVGSGLATALVIANFSGSLVSVFTASVLLATVSSLLPYLLSAAAALRLRAQLGDAGPAGGRGLVVIAAGALIYSGWAAWGSGGQALRWFGGLMLVGVVVHGAHRWRSRRPGRGAR